LNDGGMMFYNPFLLPAEGGSVGAIVGGIFGGMAVVVIIALVVLIVVAFVIKKKCKCIDCELKDN